MWQQVSTYCMVLLPQSNIMTAIVQSRSNPFSDMSSCLPTYSNHYVTQFTTIIVAGVVVVVLVAVVVAFAT